MRQEKNGDSHKSLRVYLYGNAESGNVHMSELLLAEFIARGNSDLSALSPCLGFPVGHKKRLWVASPHTVPIAWDPEDSV